jgi:hypothetical protein
VQVPQELQLRQLLKGWELLSGEVQQGEARQPHNAVHDVLRHHASGQAAQATQRRQLSDDVIKLLCAIHFQHIAAAQL